MLHDLANRCGENIVPRFKVAEPSKRLTALMARPYVNLVRYHGLFSNRSNDRPRLPPRAPARIPFEHMTAEEEFGEQFPDDSFPSSTTRQRGPP